MAAPCQATSIEVMDVLEYRRLRQLSVGGLILTFGGIISIGVAAEAPLGCPAFGGSMHNGLRILVHAETTAAHWAC